MRTKTILFFALISSIFTTHVNGQQQRNCYYWVVETNANVSNSSIVRIYNQYDEPVNEVKLNTTLDVTRKKHRQQLNRMARRFSTGDAVTVSNNKAIVQNKD